MKPTKLETARLSLNIDGSGASLMPGEAIYDVVREPGDSIVGKAKIVAFGQVAEIGYTINERQRYRGFGTAVCRHVTDLALCMYSEVFAQVDKDNLASIRILEKNGFHPDDDIGSSIIYKKTKP